jgi:hypothetical protein
MNTNDSTICSFFLQSEEIIATYYGYELQRSKLYTRRVYNIFNETYKSSTTFSTCEGTSQNGYYFIEHRVVQTEFPWLQHAFHVKEIYNHQNPENSTFFCQCMTWEHTCNICVKKEWLLLQKWLMFLLE